MGIFLTAVWALSGSVVSAGFDCETARLELDDAGCVMSLSDPASGRELAVAGRPLCQVETPEGILLPEQMTLDGDTARFVFPEGVRLSYQVTSGSGYLLFRLLGATGVDEADVTAIVHCALRLQGLRTLGDPMNAYFDDDHAVAVMGTELNVHGHAWAVEEGVAELRAATYPQYGLMPASFGIVVAPRAQFEQTIARFEVAAGLPSPRPGGEWGKASSLAERSYLFITALREDDVEDVIRWAHRGGFGTVLIGGDWSRSHGHHEINTAHFPDGLASFQRACRRLHDAGLRVGLHFLAAAVYLDDPYVTPVPDRRLVIDARGALGEAIDGEADFVPLAEPPAEFAAEDGGYMGRGTYVRIGDEIVQYSALSLEPPYGLLGCVRGALGTVASAHPAGQAVEHLHRSYGYFLYDLDSDLADEVIGNVCRVADAVEADMLYFDGSELLQGDHWYYNAKLQSLYQQGLANKDTFLQGSSYSHASWHLISRMASADGHGDVKGYLDERLPWLVGYEHNLMPADVGWYYVYEPTVTADQFDYILQKCLGYDASISVQTNPTQLAIHPEMGEIFDLVAEYERLRLGGSLPDSVRTLLREPGREYRLLRDPLRLRRTVFEDWQAVEKLGPEGVAMAVEPAGDGARLGLQVRCGPLSSPGAAYRSEEALLLEDFEDLRPYAGAPGPVWEIGFGEAGSTNEGVTQAFASVAGEGVEGARCGRLTAASDRGDAGGWSCIWRTFPEPIDLSWHAGIGLWLRGDGQGGAFKLQLRDGQYATDYYITNDFTEWRYVQLTRPEGPSPEPIDYSHVTQILFYYNGLPGKTTVTCWIDDVKALAELDEAILPDLTLTIGGQTVTFEGSLASGERLVYFPGEEPYIIPATAGERRPLPAIPDLWLREGVGEVTVSATAPVSGAIEARLVQDLPEELALPE